MLYLSAASLQPPTTRRRLGKPEQDPFKTPPLAQSAMRVAVIGSNSGRTAVATLAALVRAGHQLVLLATEPAALPDFGPSARVKIVPGKAWDAATLRDFVRGCLGLQSLGAGSPAGTPTKSQRVDAVIVVISHAEPHNPPMDVIECVVTSTLAAFSESCGCVFGERDGESPASMSAPERERAGPKIAKDGISDLFGRKDDDEEDHGLGDLSSFRDQRSTPEPPTETFAGMSLATDEDTAATGIAFTSPASSLASRRRRKAGDPPVLPTAKPVVPEPAKDDEPEKPAAPIRTSQLPGSFPSRAETPSPSQQSDSADKPPVLISSTIPPPRIVFVLPPGTPNPSGYTAGSSKVFVEGSTPSLLLRWFSGEDKVKGDSSRAVRAVSQHPARSLAVFLRPVEKVIDLSPPEQGRYVGFGSQGSQFGASANLQTRAVSDIDVKAGAQVDRSGLVDVALEIVQDDVAFKEWAGRLPLVVST